MKDQTNLININNKFIIDNDFIKKDTNEELYTNEEPLITQTDLIEKFMKVPYEIYESTLFSVNTNIIKENDINDLTFVYDTISDAILGKPLK